MEVAAIVILYNSQVGILNNILLLKEQVDYLYVFDNSPVPNAKICEAVQKISNTEYVSYNANYGISKAYNIICRKAIERGFSYVLTMDEDSKIPAGMVRSLLNYIEKYNDICIISPKHTKKYNFKNSEEELTDEFSVMSSGNLINLKAFQKVGEFDERYFIDYVDVEYCLRAKHKGFRIVCANKILLEHNEGNLEEKMFLGKKVFPYNHSPIRWFYKTRNLFLLIETYKSVFPDSINLYRKLFFSEVIKIVLYEKYKIRKLRYIVKGAIAYKKKTYGIYHG